MIKNSYILCQKKKSKKYYFNICYKNFKRWNFPEEESSNSLISTKTNIEKNDNKYDLISNHYSVSIDIPKIKSIGHQIQNVRLIKRKESYNNDDKSNEEI